jgi:hypothetical protein
MIGVELGGKGGQVGHEGQVGEGWFARVGKDSVGAIFFCVSAAVTGREHAINTNAMIISDQVFAFILPSLSSNYLEMIKTLYHVRFPDIKNL